MEDSTVPTSVAMDSALSLNAASCSNCSESLPYWSKASWDATGGVGEREREKNQSLCMQWSECICLFMCTMTVITIKAGLSKHRGTNSNPLFYKQCMHDV